MVSDDEKDGLSAGKHAVGEFEDFGGDPGHGEDGDDSHAEDFGDEGESLFLELGDSLEEADGGPTMRAARRMGKLSRSMRNSDSRTMSTA
jgi:hypothetical protein